MNATTTGMTPAAATSAAAARRHPRKPRGGPGVHAAPMASRESIRSVAAILQVLGGVLTPEQAAGVLGISPPRYYALEKKALEGMAQACEPKAPGRRPSPEREVERLRREKQCLERDCARHQALARSAQRALGLVAKPDPARKDKDVGGKRRRKRRPSARALRVARALEQRLSSVPAVSNSAVGSETSTK